MSYNAAKKCGMLLNGSNKAFAPESSAKSARLDPLDPGSNPAKGFPFYGREPPLLVEQAVPKNNNSNNQSIKKSKLGGFCYKSATILSYEKSCTFSKFYLERSSWSRYQTAWGPIVFCAHFDFVCNTDQKRVGASMCSSCYGAG
jgi:hypothetical protein